jgi:hypothetical protein
MTAILPAKLPANEKSVLNILAFHANEGGECWPSVSLLSRECCLSRSEVQKCLAWLEKREFIKRNFRDGRSTTYFINEPASNGSTHPPPLDTQNGLLNVVEEKCSPQRCKKWHKGCLSFPPPYIIGVSKRKRLNPSLN